MDHHSGRQTNKANIILFDLTRVKERATCNRNEGQCNRQLRRREQAARQNAWSTNSYSRNDDEIESAGRQAEICKDGTR